MKIIVDEMPKSAEDCVFGTGSEKRCVINNRDYCYDSVNCSYLKVITDFHATKEVMTTHNGLRIIRQFDIS